MSDAYETQSIEYVATQLYKACEAIMRAERDLNLDDLVRGEWLYLCNQLSIAARALKRAHTRAIAVRGRHIDNKPGKGA